jgi:hypothetical protein
VGRALSSPWSPRAVQARCSLLTSEIRFSMAARSGRIRSRGGRRWARSRWGGGDAGVGDETRRRRLPSRVRRSGSSWSCMVVVWRCFGRVARRELVWIWRGRASWRRNERSVPWLGCVKYRISPSCLNRWFGSNLKLWSCQI